MKKKTFLVLMIAVSIILVFVSGLSAQRYDDKKGGGKPDPQLSQEDNDYLDRQAKVFLDTVQSIIAKYPQIYDMGFIMRTASVTSFFTSISD